MSNNGLQSYETLTSTYSNEHHPNPHKGNSCTIEAYLRAEVWEADHVAIKDHHEGTGGAPLEDSMVKVTRLCMVGNTRDLLTGDALNV